MGRTDSNRDSLLPISRGLHQRKNKISLVKFKFTPIQKTTRVQISRGLHQIKKDWSEPHQTTQEFKVFTGLREREEDWSEPNSNLKIPKTEEGTDSISPQVCRMQIGLNHIQIQISLTQNKAHIQIYTGLHQSHQRELDWSEPQSNITGLYQIL